MSGVCRASRERARSERAAASCPPALQGAGAAGEFGCSRAAGPPSPGKLVCPRLQEKDHVLFTDLELVGL